MSKNFSTTATCLNTNFTFPSTFCWNKWTLGNYQSQINIQKANFKHIGAPSRSRLPPSRFAFLPQFHQPSSNKLERMQWLKLLCLCALRSRSWVGSKSFSDMGKSCKSSKLQSPQNQTIQIFFTHWAELALRLSHSFCLTSHQPAAKDQLKVQK